MIEQINLNALPYKVKQIKPNHADKIAGYKDKYLEKMFAEETVLSQRKYDGERMLLHINTNEVYCTSRRISKKTNHFMENQDKLPTFQTLYEKLNLGYTVLDGEVYAKDWSEIAGIMHSLPERAAELQKTVTVKYAVFDCLFFDGQDLRDMPYKRRLEVAQDVVKLLDVAFIHIVDSKQVKSLDEAKEHMQHFVDLGMEGIVIKPTDKAYYDVGASIKIKRMETVDCIVIDKVQGTGKYENTIGALILGYYEPATSDFVWLSKVNAGTDADRDMWRDNWESMKHSVVEVKCQEITKKSLRHPVIVRIRDDKSYDMCTKDTIFKEEE